MIATIITASVAAAGVVGQWVVARGNSKRARNAENRADNAEKRADAAEARAAAAEQREAAATQNKELIDFATFFKAYSELAETVFNNNVRAGVGLAKQLSYIDAYANKKVPFEKRFIDRVCRLNGSVDSIKQESSKSRTALRKKRDEGLIRYRKFASEIQSVYDCANFFLDDLPSRFDFFGATDESPYRRGYLSEYDKDAWKCIFEERSDSRNWADIELHWQCFIRRNYDIPDVEIAEADVALTKRYNLAVSALRDCITASEHDDKG